VHSAVIGAEALIGNGATVLDGAIIGRRALVAAGGDRRAGHEGARRHARGRDPGKVTGAVSGSALRWVENNPAAYRELARRHAAGVRPVG